MQCGYNVRRCWQCLFSLQGRATRESKAREDETDSIVSTWCLLCLKQAPSRLAGLSPLVLYFHQLCGYSARLGFSVFIMMMEKRCAETNPGAHSPLARPGRGGLRVRVPWPDTVQALPGLPFLPSAPSLCFCSLSLLWVLSFLLACQAHPHSD